MRTSSLFATVSVACLLASAVPSVATADPIWDRIKTSGKLVCGAIPGDPIGSWTDPKTGEWEGYEIELCRQIADDLSVPMGRKITPEFRETSWGTVVLDLQSQKLDLWPGMTPTPARQQALTMVGPIYSLAFCGMSREGFKFEGTWESLNKPEVRIALASSTSVELAYKRLAPKATHVILPSYLEATLAVQSGRADVMGADVSRCLPVEKSLDGVFKDIFFPTPVQSLGSSAGVPKSADQLAAWLKTWVDEKKKIDFSRTLFDKVFKKADLDPTKVPPDIKF